MCPDKVAFLNGGECGNAGDKCHGNDGPEQGGNSKEKKKTCQLVCFCMREAEVSEGHQYRNLVDDLAAGGSKESEYCNYVGDVFHPSRFPIPHFIGFFLAFGLGSAGIVALISATR